MSNDFHVKRSKQSIFEIFLSLFCRQIRDSKNAYWWIFIIVFVITLFAPFSLSTNPKHFFKFMNALLVQGDSIFSLFPPFLLTIVAIFPAFSEKTKSKLREFKKKSNEPRVAAFLDQFVFLVLLSLLLLLISKVLLGAAVYEERKEYPALDHDTIFWMVVLTDLYLALFLSLSWEILDAIKSLYILILREYFDG